LCSKSESAFFFVGFALFDFSEKGFVRPVVETVD
jgi:hypothetical protein